MVRLLMDKRLSSIEKILDVIMQEVPSRLGAILLVDLKNHIIDRIVRGSSPAGKDKVRMEIVREVIETGHPLIFSGPSREITAHIACFPFVERGKSFGCVYLAREEDEARFSNRDCEILSAFVSPVCAVLRQKTGRKSPPPTLDFNPSSLVGKSKDFFRILRFIDSVKNNDIPVFISGESGTGKEVVAKTIHSSGSRKSHPFVAINCGAIPDHLLESELFGYARGAFTGAMRDKPGLIEEASQGTFFLDEIGDLTPSLQAKLLRVIQEREIRRVGENRTRRINVRFISATNKNIETEVQEGRFREDLYYRLNIVSVDLPPLRRRREDIPGLVTHLVEKYCRKMERERAYFAPAALQLLLDYSWPGNVRELQNEIQRCLIICGGGSLIKESYLSEKIRKNNRETVIPMQDYFHAKAEFEKKFLNEALARSDYNRTRTAEEIGLSRQGLFKLMKKHGIMTDPSTEGI